MIHIWILLVALATPYVIFPVVITLLGRVASIKNRPATKVDAWPSVDIVFAAYNEEKVLRGKLDSLLALDYPAELLTIRVGSDCSSDATDDILAEYGASHPQIQWLRMPERSGKSQIINHLVSFGDSDIIVGTDANIFFDTMALKHMVRPMIEDDRITLVGGRLMYRGMQEAQQAGSIAQEERSYVNWENRLKAVEGNLFGAAMGVEGGCYAIRRGQFRSIPKGTLMEDFFLTMSALKDGHRVVMALSAHCSEDVSSNANMEFRRKIRISQGNWQNFMRFGHVIVTHPFPTGIIFFCHKALRWLFPFIAVALYVSLIMMDWRWSLSIPALVLMRWIPLPGFKALGHFTWMNLALFLGFFKYLSTRETGIWQPTTRDNT